MMRLVLSEELPEELELMVVLEGGEDAEDPSLKAVIEHAQQHFVFEMSGGVYSATCPMCRREGERAGGAA